MYYVYITELLQDILIRYLELGVKKAKSSSPRHISVLGRRAFRLQIYVISVLTIQTNITYKPCRLNSKNVAYTIGRRFVFARMRLYASMLSVYVTCISIIL